MRADAKNLKAISEAIATHNVNCGKPILAILLNPFEIERLGWDDFQGIPIKPDDKIGTGRFHLVCEGQHGEAPAEEQTVSEKPKVGEMVSV